MKQLTLKLFTIPYHTGAGLQDALTADSIRLIDSYIRHSSAKIAKSIHHPETNAVIAEAGDYLCWRHICGMLAIGADLITVEYEH